MQMGCEFGLCSLLSLPSVQGSCKELTHNLCYKCHCHVFIIWQNKLFQLHMEINIHELYVLGSQGMVWIGRGQEIILVHVWELGRAFPLDISAIVLHDIWESCVVLSPC